MRILFCTIVTVAGIALTGCAKGQDPSTAPVPQADRAPEATPPVDTRGWEIQDEHNGDGTVDLQRRTMPEAQRQAHRNEYHATTLQPVPVDPHYNVSLFKFRNSADLADTIFIAPKLYAFGSAEGGRIAPQRHADGSVSVSFPVVFIDGTRPTIASPDGQMNVSVPQPFLIQDLSQLKSELGAGGAARLAPLPGCPSQILLRVNDQEWDVTPSDLARGDYCQHETPINVTARLKEADARYLLEKALYNGAVEVHGVYEVRAAYVDSTATLSFDKSKLFRSIEAEASVHAGVWADVDARATLSDVVKQEAMSIQIEGDPGPIFDHIVDQAIQEFFTPFKPDPSLGLKQCSDSVVCLRFNGNYDHSKESFAFSWNHTSTEQVGENYLTWTKLHPLLDRAVSIGRGSNTGGNPRPELASTNPHGIETGLTAVPGDLLEITPTYLIREERDLGVPHTERAHHPVCLDEIPAHDERVCHHTCESHGVGCDTECSMHQVPASCGAGLIPALWRDEWVDTTSYSCSAPQFEHLDQPIGQMQQIFDGLALRFVWRQQDGAQHETTCKLNAFNREGDGKSIMVRLENRGTACEIFTEDASVHPMVYLVNQIDYPVAYKDGREVHTWDGKTLEVPVEKTFHPQTWFAGLISIRGYDLSSIPIGGARSR